MTPGRASDAGPDERHRVTDTRYWIQQARQQAEVLQAHLRRLDGGPATIVVLDLKACLNNAEDLL